MSEILLSIIVPVFGTEKFLPRTIENLSNQHLSNLEIIIVNDCSVGDSEEICKFYSLSLPYLRYIKLDENKGPFVARREGVKIAKGKYIGFVDSDDLIEPDYFQRLVEVIEDNDADAVRSVSIKKRDKNKQIKVVGAKFPILPLNLNSFDATKMFLQDSHWSNRNNLVLGVYKSSLVKQVIDKYPCEQWIHFAEDFLEIGLIMLNAQHIILTDIDGYLYCDDNHSATTSDISSDEAFEKCLQGCQYAFYFYYQCLCRHTQMSILKPSVHGRMMQSARYLLRLYANKSSEIDITKMSSAVDNLSLEKAQ